MYWVAPKRSVSAGESALVFFCSSAQVHLAPLSCLRLEMQALFWEAARALTKLGIAMAASMAMMATTIMISTRVKPADRLRFIFMSSLFHCGGVNEGEGVFIIELRLQ